MNVELQFTGEERRRIWSHLLPWKQRVEQVAFVFADVKTVKTGVCLICKESWLLGPDDFAIQLDYHIEITEEIRGKLIKHAHDTNRAIVELHSHLGRCPARFSGSDLAGFREWVPHVRWRLKNKPYGAVVVTKADFDGFVWLSERPERLQALKVGPSRRMHANGRSPISAIAWEEKANDNEQ